jgi:hypothetical protein
MDQETVAGAREERERERERGVWDWKRQVTWLAVLCKYSV